MEEHVRKLNAEYGFNLTEDEIKLIVQQAEETERLLRPLNELDFTMSCRFSKSRRRR
jgi:hypothetical protein